MLNLWNDLKKSVINLSANWASLAALGSFAIYVLGYLVIRFHLAVFGVGTDLSVLDERYLFAGAKFLVYVLSTIPILVLLGIVLTLVALVGAALVYIASWPLHRSFPKAFRWRSRLVQRVWRNLLLLWRHPSWFLT